MLDKTGRYEFMAEPFHCDFSKRLFMGHLGNHMLNAADFHADHRGFGMTQLNPEHKTWVLSRLAIEMETMPREYARFNVETWIESVMKYFTNRNFRVADAADNGKTYGYGRSIWALIDTRTRLPQNILDVNDGEIAKYIDTGKECPIDGLSRVKMGKLRPACRDNRHPLQRRGRERAHKQRKIHRARARPVRHRLVQRTRHTPL